MIPTATEKKGQPFSQKTCCSTIVQHTGKNYLGKPSLSLHYMKRNKTTIVVLLTLEDLPETIFLFYRVQMDRSLQQKE